MTIAFQDGMINAINIIFEMIRFKSKNEQNGTKIIIYIHMQVYRLLPIKHLSYL